MLKGLRSKNILYSKCERKLVGLTAFFLSFNCNASAIINISGTILAAPSCIVNENKEITVDFGRNISSSRVNGSNYLRNIDYSLECNNNSSNSMKMMLVGSGVSFNSRALSTTKTDLAISLIVNGQQQDINSWIYFSYPINPVLQAVLIKRTDVKLTAGDFSASATLRVEYQ
ncbi:fimbrial protein [Rahnella aceris]|uniref:fimbrial protein n=1 Tax=Rahnella sp. (strain Y9602) TaxID=2703885 RepID=UPI000EB12395|nr:type 1 fimbria pilin [Rahnella aquatilis]